MWASKVLSGIGVLLFRFPLLPTGSPHSLDGSPSLCPHTCTPALVHLLPSLGQHFPLHVECPALSRWGSISGLKKRNEGRGPASLSLEALVLPSVASPAGHSVIPHVLGIPTKAKACHLSFLWENSQL